MATITAPDPKQQAHRLIDQLPDSANWDDIAYALALVSDIEAGLADSDADRVVDTKALRARFGLPE